MRKKKIANRKKKKIIIKKAGLTTIDSFAPTKEAPAYAGLSTGLA
jgi:hypothetical protein